MRGDNLSEGVAKFCVEDAVDDGVKGRIEVAKPGEYLKDDFRYAGFAEWCGNIHCKEGHPAEQEHADNNAQCDGGLVIVRLVLDSPAVERLIERPDTFDMLSSVEV